MILHTSQGWVHATILTSVSLAMQSRDFTINRFSMKLFKTSNMEIVNYCQTLFGCELPSTLLERRFQKFISAL